MVLTMVFSMVPATAFATVTNADLVISTADQLKAFADEVNSGNSYQGKTVVLANDIDLEYTAVVIGTKTNPFKGTFDGQGYTVANLTVYECGADNDYFADTDDCVGLFGVINTPAVVKNVTVSDPFIVGSSYVGGIVGMAYTGTIENCHVVGEIDIEGYYMVGGITGHGYAKIYNCSVIGAEGWDYSYIGASYQGNNLEGDNVGGIVGHNAESNTISGCAVKNVTVSGTRKVGGIVGITAQSTTITNCTVSNVTVETTATEEYANANTKTMSIGGIVGQYMANGNGVGGKLSDCKVEGLTFANENGVAVNAGALTGGVRASSGTTFAPAEESIAVSGNAVSKVEGENVSYMEPVVVWDGINIDSLSDLKAFRDAVNAGDNFAGKTVVLNVDIDLEGEEWIPIGYMGKNFVGTFDGQNHTISNLVITKTTDNTAANNGIGLFGRVDDPAVIKNLTIENVDITGSLYVGAVVGHGYTGKSIENVTVKGDITIDAWWYAGVIGGNGYMNLVQNCHVVANDGSYIKGNNGSYIGGIWGFRGENANKIIECTVTNLDIIGVDRVGGICGIGHYGNIIADCEVKDSTITATDPEATTVGLIVGACQGTASEPTVFDGNATSNTTAQKDNGDGTFTTVTNIYGTNIDGSKPITNVVVTLNGVPYNTLAEAIAAAKNGDVITVQTDIELTETLTIPAGKTIVLELNGKTISQTKAQTEGYQMIMNDGNLTIQDSVGGGKISYTDSGNGGNYISNTITNRGTLTLLSGTVENLSSSTVANNGFPYAVDTSIWGSADEVNLIIKGGKVYCESYSAIRLRADSETEPVNVTITGGQVYGRIEVQNPTSNKASAGKLTISGGEIYKNNSSKAIVFFGGGGTADNIEAEISGGTIDGEIGGISVFPIDNLDKQIITGGSFTVAPGAEWCAEGYVVKKNDNGTYGIVSGSYVVEINGTKYLTLADAFAAAENGDVIVLLNDVVLDASINNTKNVTLDLNGKTITGTDNTEKNFGLLNNTGVLTINDSVGGGAIFLTATVNSGWNRYSAVISNNPGGTLVVNGGIIEHLGGTDMAYAIDSLTNNNLGDVSVTINGGIIKSTYRAIRQFLNSNSMKNELIINGGVVEGANKGVFFHDPSTKANNGTLVIGDNATVNSVYLYVTEGSTEWPVEVSISTKAVAAANVTSKNVPEGLGLQNYNGTISIAEVPELPTASVSSIKNNDLTFAMNFKVNPVTQAQLAYYGNWYADFELVINKTIVLNNDGSADGWLAGQYDDYSSDWLTVPYGKYAPVTLNANEALKIMAFAAEITGEPGLKYTYAEIYEIVRDFDCGMYLDNEFLAANPDLEVKLVLKMYNPADESESYIIGETYTFTNPSVAQNTTTNKVYATLSQALMDCAAGQTVILLKDVNETIVPVLENTTLDLNGHTLTASYVSSFGDIVDNSADNSGLLKVAVNRFMVREENAQLPVRDGDGYRFVQVQGIATAYVAGDKMFAFQVYFEPEMLALLLQGQESTGVTIQVKVSWKETNGYRSQNFIYTDEFVQTYLNSYNSSSDWYGEMFTLVLDSTDEFQDLTFTAVAVSETGVAFASAPLGV